MQIDRTMRQNGGHLEAATRGSQGCASDDRQSGEAAPTHRVCAPVTPRPATAVPRTTGKSEQEHF
jgi:hypothetical protein